MAKYFFSIILLLSQLVSFGQDSDYTICDCCTYSMFQYKNDYDNVFPPAEIKANGIKEVTIYTTSKQRKLLKDTAFKTVDAEYKEMVFRFNNDGYVLAQLIFNRRGKYHSTYEFTRDNNNKVLSKTFHYLNETGNKMEDFIPEKWIYVYADNQLVKVKKLGDKFIEQPDNKSDYNAYAYDSKGRVITETSQSYYDWTEPSYYQTKTKYNDTTNTSVATTRNKKSLFSTVKTKYTLSQKTLNQKYFSGRDKKLLQETVFTYNSTEQLTKQQVKSSGIGTECPDGNNFTNTIFYSSKNLMDRISHRYKNTVCELRFVYQ
jgi:hypothetical protein